MAFYFEFNVLIFVIVHLSFVRPAAVHDNIARSWPQASKTVVTTTTESTFLACVTLVEPLATTVCRKRQLWAVFYTVVHDDIDQFNPVNPAQVLRVEPSVLPDVVNQRSVFFPNGQFINPSAVQSSLDNGPIQSAMRIADPYLFSAFLTSLFSNLFPAIPAVTSTDSVYTSTITSTVFTATSTYTLSAVSCLPVDVITCPATPDAPITDVLIVTEDPITEDPVTDVL